MTGPSGLIQTNPAPSQSPAIAPAIRAVLDAMRFELAREDNPPQHYRMVPGVQPVFALAPTVSGLLDECCQGVAFLRIVNIFPCDDFPNPAAVWLPHDDGEVSWGVTLDIGVARCGQSAPGSELAPTDDQYTADVMTILSDVAALHRVGPYLMKLSAPPIYEYAYSEWQPAQAEGGCVGGSMQFHIQVAACDFSQA